MRISPELSVGALVAERIGRARVFERLGIDYCCRGATSLGSACAARSLDVDQVLAELAESDVSDLSEDEDRIDWNATSVPGLVDHIVATHHVFLRRELPRLARLIETVVDAHGSRHPELTELREMFAGLQAELESHMVKEEQVLFPLAKRLAAADAPFPIHCGTVDNPIRVMEHEHEAVGEVLDRLRILTGDYQPPADGCPTFQALYEGLARLEADLHRHIHKENNVLFPKTAALEAALIGSGP
ncbi:MAG: iron-sulfur cluster repair di-iron protein [Isosphaeraceae bacterium]